MISGSIRSYTNYTFFLVTMEDLKTSFKLSEYIYADQSTICAKYELNEAGRGEGDKNTRTHTCRY